MGYLDQMADVERRANALNLNITATCRRAGVRYPVWWRWRRGDVSPMLVSFQDAMARMTAALDAEEARLRQVLERVS